jgi:two-component system, cell cycle sensor histidine kinase and response regulator CckA
VPYPTSEPDLDRLADLARRALRAPFALVTLAREGGLVLCGSARADGVALPAEPALTPESLCQRLFENGAPLVIRDAEREAEPGSVDALRRWGIAAYLAMPLGAGDEPAGGTICVLDTVPRDWTEREIGLLEGLALNATARREAERALRESEQRFRTLAHSLDQVFWMSDLHTAATLYVSPAFEKVWDRSCEELYRDPEVWIQDVHPADRDRVVEATVERRSHGFDLEYRILKRNGDVRWIHDRGVPVADGTGAVVYLAGIAEDVTERMAAEAELRALFTAMQDAIFVIGRDGRYRRVAPTGAGLLYRAAAELEGRTFHDVLPPEQADEFLAAVGRALADRGTVRLEYRLPIDGSEKWFAATVSPLDDEQVVWVARDMTAERMARETLQRQAVVFDTVSDGIVIAGADGRIVDWNPAAERIFGHARQEALGRSPQEVIPGEGAPEPAELWRVLGTEGVWQGELVVSRPDGETVTCDVAVFPIRGVDGAMVGTVGVNRDVTQKRQLEEQLWHAQKLEATGRLAGGIAHDFNNLLTAIQGFAILLETSFAAGDPRRENVAEIQRAAERAAALTRHLLAFARKQVTRPEPLDLNAHFHRTLPLLRRMVGSHIEVRTELDPELGTVLIDPLQLDQILTNLTINARDAMAAGGTLTIRTRNVRRSTAAASLRRVLRGEDYVAVAVQDTGIGMSDEVRARLFEPFFTTKPQGRGTGLGLSTVYGIVTQNDGYVLVDTAPGRGATFNVYLPAVAAAPAEGAPAVPASGELVRANDDRRGTILLAEDEAGVRSLVRLVLTRAGFRVLEAADGSEALRLFETHAERIDLVVTDLLMPGVTGQVLHERIHAVRPALPVVFMSGYTDPLPGQELTAGVPFLHKPFHPNELLAMVRAALSGR